ncbi:hypothetical protein [Saccharopolyspora pogona]|uniref:hypothetical protein n=1 Tax=Saccharopolyspora pogona TaxID=333966 RepID=UPI0016898F80|nr:hypothetical protein [Saccharopolyspora pogona]
MRVDELRAGPAAAERPTPQASTPALVGWTGSEATAYLPAFVPPFIATNKLGMALALAVVVACAFAITALANLHHRRKQRA